MCSDVSRLACSLYNSDNNIARHSFVVLPVLALFSITCHKVNKLNCCN
jgi:hypothetical protein